MIDSQNSIKGIKLVLGRQTKRINEKVEFLENLKEKIKSIFNVNELTGDKNFEIMLYSLQADGEKGKLIRNEEEYSQELSKCKSSCIKFLIELEIESRHDHKLLSEVPCLSHKDYINNEALSKEYAKNFIGELFYKGLEKFYKMEGEEKINRKERSDSFNNSYDLISKIDILMTNKLKLLEQNLNSSLQNYMSSSILEKSHLYKPDNKIDFEISSIHPLYARKESLEKIEKDDQNNIKLEGSDMEYVDIELKQPPKHLDIFNDICSICSRNIHSIKFTCCICTNLTACEKCESLHLHPMIKFKTKELSTKDDILYYMINNLEPKNIESYKNLIKKAKEISENLFEKKFKLKMYQYSDYFTVRPNKKFKIPLIIHNDSKEKIPKSKISILTKNHKDLKISSQLIDSEISGRERFEINLECESNDQLKLYDFQIFIYSPEVKIECEPLNMKIEVNNDEEEESMNEYFAMYSKILSISKKEKSMIKKILQDGICQKHPYVIYNIMNKYNWDLEKALDELTYDDRKNFKPVKI
jgi:hypothetical protein